MRQPNDIDYEVIDPRPDDDAGGNGTNAEARHTEKPSMVTYIIIAALVLIAATTIAALLL